LKKEVVDHFELYRTKLQALELFIDRKEKLRKTTRCVIFSGSPRSVAILTASAAAATACETTQAGMPKSTMR